MDTILLIIGGLFISYVAIRLWILFWDTIASIILRPFHKKKQQKWHYLDGTINDKEVTKETVDNINDL